jgi:hypothetical protein
LNRSIAKAAPTSSRRSERRGAERERRRIPSARARGAAAAIALACGFGLLMQFDAALDDGRSPFSACWTMLRYFDSLTALLAIPIFFTFAMGKGRLVNRSLMGGATIATTLVGIGSCWLPAGSPELGSEKMIADALLDDVVPLAAIVFWLELAPKGKLTVRHALLWTVYPLVYFDYSLLRGAAESNFAYRFLDGNQLGWDRTFWTALLFLLTFVDLGLAMVWVDGALAVLANKADAGR